MQTITLNQHSSCYLPVSTLDACVNGSHYNQFHNFLRLFDVLPNFLSPEVKRWTIITYKHGIYELLHELSNNLRLRILGN